jgi:MFS family permease
VSLVALPWLVLSGGGSAGAAGIVFTVSTLPYVLFGLPAGVVGDRLPRRRVIYGSHALQTLLAASIPVWSLAAAPPIALVLAAAFAVGAGRVFSDAAAFGAMAAIAGRDQVLGAQAALSAAWSIGLFAGPAAGGALIAVIGPARAIALEAAAFAVAALLVAAIRTRLDVQEEGERPPGRAWLALREGLAYIARDPVVRAFTITSFLWHASIAGTQSLAVPLLREELSLGAGTTGRVLGAAAIAALLATATVSTLERRLGPVGLAWIAMVGSALAVGGMGIADDVAVAIVAVCAAQALITVFFTNMVGVRQRRAPHALQARVGISGRMLALAAVALGSAVASVAADLVGVRAVYEGMAIATLAVTVATAPLMLEARRAHRALTSGS